MPNSIIPKNPGQTPSYFCTWELQNYLAKFIDPGKPEAHTVCSDALTEKALAEHIHETDFLKRIRGDLLFLLDLGWDVPLRTDFNNNCGLLGSMIVAEEKFAGVKDGIYNIYKEESIYGRTGEYDTCPVPDIPMLF